MSKSKTLYISMSRNEKILGWLYMAFSLLALPTLLRWGNDRLAQPLDETNLNFVYYLMNFSCLLVIFRHFLHSLLK